MKMVCDKFNLNIYDVINASRTKPFGFTTFLPGPGMGGHCIPIDPLFISWAAKKKGITANFIENSRKVNQMITSWIIKKVENINISGMKGFEIIAEGKEKEMQYQVLLFAPEKYYLIYGEAKTDQEKNLEIFKKVAKTFMVK